MTESAEVITTPPEIKIESSTIVLGSTIPSTTLEATEAPTTSVSLEELTTQKIKTDPPSTTAAVTSIPTTEGITEVPNFPEVTEESTTLSPIETGKHHYYSLLHNNATWLKLHNIHMCIFRINVFDRE